jgi:hypothetical protein
MESKQMEERETETEATSEPLAAATSSVERCAKGPNTEQLMNRMLSVIKSDAFVEVVGERGKALSDEYVRRLLHVMELKGVLPDPDAAWPFLDSYSKETVVGYAVTLSIDGFMRSSVVRSDPCYEEYQQLAQHLLELSAELCREQDVLKAASAKPGEEDEAAKAERESDERRATKKTAVGTRDKRGCLKSTKKLLKAKSDKRAKIHYDPDNLTDSQKLQKMLCILKYDHFVYNIGKEGKRLAKMLAKEVLHVMKRRGVPPNMKMTEDIGVYYGHIIADELFALAYDVLEEEGLPEEVQEERKQLLKSMRQLYEYAYDHDHTLSDLSDGVE